MINAYTLQVIDDLHAFMKAVKADEHRVMIVSEDQARALSWSPKPFEFAKLEQWKPSKHAKRKR